MANNVQGFCNELPKNLAQELEISSLYWIRIDQWNQISFIFAVLMAIYLHI